MEKIDYEEERRKNEKTLRETANQTIKAFSKKPKERKICSICEKPVLKDLDQINGAVTGEYIEIVGHHTCCKNVNRLIVIPNRFRTLGA